MKQVMTKDDAPFKFFTGTLKAYQDNEGNRYIAGVASDTLVDRDGDRMSTKAIGRMRETAEQNLTIFGNHKYDWEDSLGSCVKAATNITKSAAGNDQMDMEIVVRLEPEEANPKTNLLYKKIAAGTKLGFSIGGKVLKAFREFDTELRREVNVIDDVELVEISVVGIPANPRAMISAISKSLNGLAVEEVAEPTEPLQQESEGVSEIEGGTEMEKEVQAEAAKAATQPEGTDPVSTATESLPVTKGVADNTELVELLKLVAAGLQSFLSGQGAGAPQAGEEVQKEDEPAEEENANEATEPEPEAPAAEEQTDTAPAESETPAEEESADPTGTEAPAEEEPVEPAAEEDEEGKKKKPPFFGRKGVETETEVTVKLDPEVTKAFTELSEQLAEMAAENEELRNRLKTVEDNSKTRKGIVPKPASRVEVADDDKGGAPAPKVDYAKVPESERNELWAKSLFPKKFKRG